MGNSGSLSREILQIKSYLDSLKPAEKRVAEYVIENSGEVVYSSITNLADQIGVSEATIVKFCQRVGYSGYQELKIMLARADRQSDDQEIIYGAIEPGDSIANLKDKLLQIYDQSLENTHKLIETDLYEEVVARILRARRIYFFGYGASGIVARDAELKFVRIGLPAIAITDSHSQKTVASLLKPDDLVLAISDSGRTRELIEVLDILEEIGCQRVAITSQVGSPVSERSEITLLTSSRETPYRGSAIASRIAQLAVIDILFLATALANHDETTAALQKTREAMQISKEK
ncbi:MAG: MurR/RpiR family transcriptional regulator [Halarsenatibacteraceae bacterium]